MNEQEIDIAYFEGLLNKRLREICELTETGDNAAKPVELDQTRVGRLSRMDAMQAQAMSVEAKRRREAELKNIKAALLRTGAGTYGECLECSEMISVARLEFNPSTPYCIQCAESKE